MAVSFLDLNKQYQTMKAEIDAAIATVIADGTFIKGPHADRFEAEFAAYQRVGYCIGCANGTDAIEMALEALDLPKGSEVIVPANTFISTSEAVTRSGLKVVFWRTTQSRSRGCRTRSPRRRVPSSRCICTDSPAIWKPSCRSQASMA